ncbi:MAG: hypothetical protein IID44_13275 [Planctomycetes bacterium]|nr:hypothetical protein [Planctomycetota bacterium]
MPDHVCGQLFKHRGGAALPRQSGRASCPPVVKDELRALLQRQHIQYDERYLWD